MFENFPPARGALWWQSSNRSMDVGYTNSHMECVDRFRPDMEFLESGCYFFCCCVLGTQFPLDRDSREAGLKADLRLKFLLYFTGPFQQLFPVLLCLTWAANCNFYARRIFRCAWVALLKCWQHCSDCFDVSLLGVKTLLLSSTFFNGVICQMSKYEYTLLRETLNLVFLQLMELSEIKSTANQQKKRKIQSRFSSGCLLLTFLFSFPADCEAKTPSHRNSEKAAAHSHFWQCGKRYWVIIFGPSRHWHPPEIFRGNVVICGSALWRRTTSANWLIDWTFFSLLIYLSENSTSRGRTLPLFGLSVQPPKLSHRR